MEKDQEKSWKRRSQKYMSLFKIDVNRGPQVNTCTFWSMVGSLGFEPKFFLVSPIPSHSKTSKETEIIKEEITTSDP